jgi:gliding motility-associated-like protein
MPSAFTPNGDGLNDVFVPEGEWVNNFSMEIFNRWGELIHQSIGFDNGWKGEKQPEGVYVWRIQYEDERYITHQLQGKVTLTRSVQPQP